MLLAVFADVHGNVSSLEKALKLMATFKPDSYLFLGDMAGYYYYQNESIELLNELECLVSIKGNHDNFFLNALKDKKLLKPLNRKYGQSYSMLCNDVTDSSKKFFYNMSDCEKNKFYEAYHGSPHNFLDEYIYKETNIQLQNEIPFIFLGHTHYPMIKRVKDTIIVNPGSIGQPRDYSYGSFAMVHLEDKKIEHVRYNYPKSKLINTVKKLKDNEYLYKVLQRKKID